MLARRVAPRLTAPAAGGMRFASESESPRFSGTPEAGESKMDKLKKEMIKMLKLQLILVPVTFCAMLWMYPPVSKDEEKKLRERYEKSAGWKT